MYHCDGVFDCSDHSDEKDCRKYHAVSRFQVKKLLHFTSTDITTDFSNSDKLEGRQPKLQSTIKGMQY